jgi:hypothetical protein
LESLRIIKPDPVPEAVGDVTLIDTTVGNTFAAIPAIEPSGRGEVSPCVDGRTIEECEPKLLEDATAKEPIPASSPLSTPAIIAVRVELDFVSELVVVAEDGAICD